jgi:hypothetical protein
VLNLRAQTIKHTQANPIDCCVVGFTEDNIGFACVCFIVWAGRFSTNNQIIQAIAVDLILSSAKPTTQQSIYLLLPMAQGVLSLTAREYGLIGIPS